MVLFTRYIPCTNNFTLVLLYSTLFTVDNAFDFQFYSMWLGGRQNDVITHVGVSCESVYVQRVTCLCGGEPGGKRVQVECVSVTSCGVVIKGSPGRVTTSACPSACLDISPSG